MARRRVTRGDGLAVLLVLAAVGALLWQRAQQLAAAQAATTYVARNPGMFFLSRRQLLVVGSIAALVGCYWLLGAW